MTVGFSMTDKGIGDNTALAQCAQPKFRSVFRAGDALLESAIAVTSVEVRHARNQAEHEEAMQRLTDLQAQRGRY